MKKIMLSVALLAAIVITSCGETACSCKEKINSLATDMDNLKERQEKVADLEVKCKGFTCEQYEKCK